MMYLLENLAMRMELLKAPISAPMGIQPLSTPEAVPGDRSISKTFLIVSMSIWPRYTMQYPK